MYVVGNCEKLRGGYFFKFYRHSKIKLFRDTVSLRKEEYPEFTFLCKFR
jgi:hypothetical protein